MFVHPPSPNITGSCYHDAYRSLVNAVGEKDGSSQGDQLPHVVALVVACNPDALCACIIFSKLLQQDNIPSRVYPCLKDSALDACMEEINQRDSTGASGTPKVRSRLTSTRPRNSWLTWDISFQL